MEKLLTIVLSNEVVLGYIIAAIAAIWGWLKRKADIKDERLQKGVLFLEEGVEEVWNEVVKDLKVKAADGKLTANEKKSALAIAKAKAVGYAKKEGWNLFTYIAEETIPIIIRKIVDGRKPGKNV